MQFPHCLLRLSLEVASFIIIVIMLIEIINKTGSLFCGLGEVSSLYSRIKRSDHMLPMRPEISPQSYPLLQLMIFVYSGWSKPRL